MKRMGFLPVGLISVALLLGGGGYSHAQWAQQVVPLTNGWNAVYLTVQPYPAELDAQMAGLPVRAVHRCARVFSVEQFSSSVESPLDRGAEWLVWYPPESPHHVVNTLTALLGATPYLVECYGQATWTVTGYPVAPHYSWVPDALNYVGLPVDPSNRPVFASYFKDVPGLDLTPEVDGKKVFEVLASGEQLDISSQTATYKIEAGKAYWIMAEGVSDFTGPIKVQAPPGGLRFDGNRPMLSFSVRNDSDTNRVVTVRLRTSAPPPAGMPAKIGDVPLIYFDQGDDGFFGWQTFDLDTVIRMTIASGQEGVVSLAADRPRMSDHGTNATWQSLIRVTGDEGTLVQLPVSAEWGADNPYAALWPEGLWVGWARATAVSFVASDGVTAPQPVSSPFSFRLILHQGSNNTLRLLQQVVTTWNAQGEHYELSLAGPSSGDTNEAFRISSSVFPPNLNLVMTGSLLEGCSGTFVIGAGDACNPWRHVYHPDHNQPEDALRIETTLALTPEAPAPDMGGAALWKPEESMTGTFVQEIHGLRKQTVKVTGTYEIRRVGRISVLK